MKKLTTLAIVSMMIATISSISLFTSSKIFAETRQNQGESSSNILRGRDIVNIGKFVSISGVLGQEGAEWILVSDQAKFNIHLGPVGYRDYQGFSMKVGATAKVTGKIYKNDIAVFVIETGGKAIILRDKNGNPIWAGTRFGGGSNRNSVEIPIATETLENVPEL
jgi:hypothetical protein